MAESASKKKLVTKVASEIQVSADQIVEFLKTKGHDKIRKTSSIDEQMYNELAAHFKKERDQVEKRQKIKEQLSEKQEEKIAVTKLVDTVTIDRHVHVEAKAPSHVQEISPVEEKVEIREGETKLGEAQAPVVEVIEQEKVIVPENVPATIEETAKEQGTEVAGSPSQIPSEKIIADKEMAKRDSTQTLQPVVESKVKPKEDSRIARKEEGGLKIRGRIDLRTGRMITEEELRLRKELEEAEKKTKEAAAELETETQGHKKKKKKKKKIREESAVEPAVAAEITEEDLKKRKRKKGKHPDVDEAEVELAFQRTMASIDEAGDSERAAIRKKKRKEKFEAAQREIEKQEKEKRKLKLPEFVSVGELAKLMEVDVADVISKCISFGLMVSINQRLDLETITLLADDFGYEVELQEEYTDELLEDKPDPKATLEPRPPVVTIMGHVDHGKTSLLDFIRQTNVVAGEAGGITQHIGAYQVEIQSGSKSRDGGSDRELPGGVRGNLSSSRKITFLDTPGHEAFTAMRARGAQVTDIVILVVAADDNVMPQTIEAINHARAANVPMIVAINKIDRPEANPDRIRKQLADQNVLLEEWGGKTQSVEISAKKGTNVELLLEKVLLEAEILDLKANPNRLARGVVVESTLDKGRGAVATVLVQKGTLKVGDPFVAGTSSGKVRAMTDERENRIEAALPSMPVQVVGFDDLPLAGDVMVAVVNDKFARDISSRRRIIKREHEMRGTQHHVTLEDISKEIKEGMIKQLNIVVKGDVDGSVEALSDALAKLSNDEVRVQVIHKAVGAISESDILLAAASNAVVLGFHVRPGSAARKLAEVESVEIKLYSVIYDAIENVRKGLEGLLSPEISESVVGSVEVRQIFKVPKIGTVAGCHVTDGKIRRNNRARLIRDGIVVYEGNIASLKRFKDDVREVEEGYECGLSLENFNDIKVGDIIEPFVVVETQRTLE